MRGEDRVRREELRKLILEEYSGQLDHPWSKYPENEVFRHGGSRKWFALAMTIPRSRLGLSGEGKIDVVNFKCGPVLVGSLLQEPGVYPAYHMNKTNWVSVALDGTAAEDTIRFLLETSFRLTGEEGRREP